MTVLDDEQSKRLESWIRFTGIAAFLLVPLGVFMAASVAPLLPDCDVAAAPNCQTSPIGQKIFYFHVPAAFAAYLALTLLAVGSYRFLAREAALWDAFAVGAAEVGVLFSAVTLYTGSMWGHLEWGAGFGYWNNDDTKLVLTLVLFLVYVGYLILRRQIDDPRRRARIAAVYALFGFATVPLSYIAQRVWRSIHPTVFDPGNPQAGLVTPWVEETFAVNTAALFALALYLMLVRLRLEVRRRDLAGGAE